MRGAGAGAAIAKSTEHAWNRDEGDQREIKEEEAMKD
jgi:hypothetical protein